MFDRILFPTDGSEGAKTVRDHVYDLAEHQDATVHILNVADTTAMSVTRVEGEVTDALEHQGEQIVQEVAAAAADQGINTVTEVLQGGVPETIVEYVDEYGMDLVIMPTRGRTGLNRLLLGSVTDRVIRSASVPVLTVNPEADRLHFPYRDVLVPTDGSETADKALECGVNIVNTCGATLHLLSIVNVPRLGVDISSDRQIDVLEERAAEVIDEATAYAERESVTSVDGTVEHGSVLHQEILSYVEAHDVGLIVIGTHGRTGLDRYLVGSVAAKVVRTAPVPVMTVPK